MAFYKPYTEKIQLVPAILYIENGVEQILHNSRNEVKKHLEDIYKGNIFQSTTDYTVNFLWEHDDKIVTDVWSMYQLGIWSSGPLSDVQIFQGKEKISNVGIASGNTLRVLGLEEEHRISIYKLSDFLIKKNSENNILKPHELYLELRPDLPADLDLDKQWEK
jgi:hypothetical protein